MVHMGVHRGKKYPCNKCGKSLQIGGCTVDTQLPVSMVRRLHAPTVVSSIQVPRGWNSTRRPSMVLMLLMRALIMSVHTVVRSTGLGKVGLNISLIVRPILIERVLIFAGLLAVLQQTIYSVIWGTSTSICQTSMAGRRDGLEGDRLLELGQMSVYQW